MQWSKTSIWEQAYDLLISLEKKRVLDFLFLLSRADPPVISPVRKKQFFHAVGRLIGITPKSNKRAALRSAAFEWMRSVLQKEISDDALRREIGDLPDLDRVLKRAPAMVVSSTILDGLLTAA